MTEKQNGRIIGKIEPPKKEGKARIPSPEEERSIFDDLRRAFSADTSKMRIRYYYYDEGDNYFIEMSEQGKLICYQVYKNGSFGEDTYIPLEVAVLTRSEFIKRVASSLNMSDLEVEEKLMQVVFSVKQRLNGILDK